MICLSKYLYLEKMVIMADVSLLLNAYSINVTAFGKQFGSVKSLIRIIIWGGLGCSLNRCEEQRFFSSLMNEPRQSRWAAIDEARSDFMRLLPKQYLPYGAI